MKYNTESVRKLVLQVHSTTEYKGFISNGRKMLEYINATFRDKYTLPISSKSLNFWKTIVITFIVIVLTVII